MPYIKTPSGINWLYRLKGKGKTLVFIHGWSFDSSVWIKQINYFNDYKIIILDLPGHGNSGYKECRDIINDLYFLFKKLGLENINLVGHSLGGLLALEFALQHSKLINKIILVGTNAKFIKSDNYQHGLSQLEVDKLKGFLSGNYPDILLVFMRWLFTKQERSQDGFRRVWNVVAKRKVWPQKQALDGFLSIIEKADLRGDLKNINKPTLLIFGTEDPICPVESLEFINEQINDSKIELFQDCGHLPFLTQTRQFNKVIKEFLA